MRDVARQAVFITVYGSIIAGLVKIFGVERSMTWVAVIGFGVGWFAHWLWGALLSLKNNGLTNKDPYRAP